MTYHLLSFFMKLLAILPFRVLYFLSDCIYYLIYYIVRYRRTIVRKNLIESFPEKREQEIILIEKKFYKFFTDNIFESFKMATISRKEISCRMKFKNVEAVNSLLNEGKSISLYLGHYGNWEWISSMPLHLKEGVVAAQIYHELHNDDMNRLILNNRARMGAVNVEMRKTARYINELSIQNRVSIIGFIADQSPKKQDSRYFIPFLNHNVPVLTGTEKITKHYGFEALFIKVRRVKRGYYEAEFVKMHDNPKSLPDFELTSIYFSMLEDMIKAAPELYLWTHNRFKHAI
ncbi:lysophospholipid acyltransferase family protein [uncultured Bacteroides sp.]|uniref:lysophospholipid acyltransferase family protein n=1 Tax=uncultured Bacteroides sp. TaxID=162156 RepID=UPI002615005F|nr:lysophospholipid acyltransferase family protein [uncultured Bacteroides sp.]